VKVGVFTLFFSPIFLERRLSQKFADFRLLFSGKADKMCLLRKTGIGYDKDNCPADHAVSGDRWHLLKQMDMGVGESMQTVLGAY
jgi:hypothetical protein